MGRSERIRRQTRCGRRVFNRGLRGVPDVCGYTQLDTNHSSATERKTRNNFVRQCHPLPKQRETDFTRKTPHTLNTLICTLCFFYSILTWYLGWLYMGKTCTPLSWASESDTTVATLTGSSNTFMPAPVFIPCDERASPPIPHNRLRQHATSFDATPQA